MTVEMLLLTIIGIYLAVGIIVLAVFDLLTSRIRNRIAPATDETQSKFANTGQWMSRRGATAFVVLATWVLWPVVIYGYVESRRKRRDDADKIQR